MTHPITEDLHSVYTNLQKNISLICAEAKRSPSDIELIAVTKTVAHDRIAAFYNMTSHCDFGENYAQELCDKAEALAALPLRWHFIGQLQSNKIARIVKVATSIQSVESLKHARFIHRYASEYNKLPYRIYLGVNGGDEPQKAGITPQNALELAASIQREFPGLNVCGIMSIPPAQFANATEVPDLYRQLAQLARQIGDGKLSLGMSGDFAIAIKAGSHCLRIGSLIFGERQPHA